MAIDIDDIKLVKSQFMNDTNFGGGGPTGNVVQDGLSNDIFPDVSDLNRTTGRVSLRKLFVHVQTPDTEMYDGANVILSKPPEDPNISVTLFTTRDMFDRRQNAASRIEAYLNGQGEIPGYLYENHIAGQRAIQIFARPSAAIPVAGHVFVLRYREGFVDFIEQYVRITRVTVEERTFTYATDVDYKALIITCDISDALREDYPGSPAARSFTRDLSKSIIRDTVVADATVYYGAVKLAEDIDMSDVTLKVDSIYSQLVPNARTETSLLDQRLANQFVNLLANSPREVIVAGSPLSQRIRIGQENRGYNFVTILSPLPAPGSVQVTFRALKQNYRLYDDGEGNLQGSGSGTVNYLTGSVSVTLAAQPDDRSAVGFYWGPNTAYTNRSGSMNWRSPEYTFDLDHDGITPTSFQAQWLSGGVLKTAVDNGTGKITGHATGELIYATGMVYLRPTAMPDAGTQLTIDYTWSTMVEEAHPGLVPDGAGVVAFTFAQQPAPGTVQVQWISSKQVSSSGGASATAGATNKSQMANSNSSNTSTTTTAMVETTRNYRSMTADVVNAYNSPKEDSSISQTQEGMYGPKNYEVTTKVPVTTTTSHSTSGTGSSSTSTGSTYSTASSQSSKSGVATYHMVTDNGSGAFFGTLGTVNYVGKSATLKVQGDYTESAYESNYEKAENFESLNATGEATTTAGNTSSGGVSTDTSSGGGGSSTAKGGAYGSASSSDVFGGNSLVVRYKTGSPTPTAHSETYTPPGITLDLCPNTTDVVVPGSVQFQWMGVTYVDFEGVIYRNRTDTDSGVACGRMIYTSGCANMNDYIVGGSPTTINLQSLWTRKPREHIANFSFTTQMAPVKPTGLVLSILDTDGNQLIGTADLDGNITGTHIHGKIDYDSGLVEVQTGDYVLNSGLTAKQKDEWWYNADDVRVADGKIWRPWPIDPDTLRYNAVSYFYLPLDANVLGLDPVRLPQDGRVPIFRSGSPIVIGHSQKLAAHTYANGDDFDCGRERLSRVRIIGANGNEIKTGWTVDLESGLGEVTDITGWVQPVQIEHRIEDFRNVAEVQIDGKISLISPISHDYPADETYVSSALILNDMQAVSEPMFDQVSWNNVWSDAPVGSPATGTYDETNYPLVLTNEGTVTERWALVVNTGGTTISVIGEHLGVIATGTFTSDIAPINKATNAPYFVLDRRGWGSGWATGNVNRFNTVGAIAPLYEVRTVQPSEPSLLDYNFETLIRGGINRP